MVHSECSLLAPVYVLVNVLCPRWGAPALLANSFQNTMLSILFKKRNLKYSMNFITWDGQRPWPSCKPTMLSRRVGLFFPGGVPVPVRMCSFTDHEWDQQFGEKTLGQRAGRGPWYCRMETVRLWRLSPCGVSFLQEKTNEKTRRDDFTQFNTVTG